MKCSGIVLAGGRSSRLGKPKPLLRVSGQTMLERVCTSLSEVAFEIVVSTSSQLKSAITGLKLNEKVDADVVVAVDLQLPCSGPLRGVVSSLPYVTGDVCFLLASDMPYISSRFLKHLLSRLNGRDCVVPVWPDGTIEPLASVFQVKVLKLIASILYAMGRRRPGDLVRGARTVFFQAISELPWEAALELLNVNTSRDLSIPVESWARENLRASLEIELNKSIGYLSSLCRYPGFWSALSAEVDGDYGKAADMYEREARMYLDMKLMHLARHALKDAAWCWRKAGESSKAEAANSRVRSLELRLHATFSKS